MKHNSDIIKEIKDYFMRRRMAKEAYKFEQKMEQDPFLYEAIEGFEDLHVSEVQQALDELDDRLDRKSKNSFQFSWKVAASIAAVIGLGFIGYSILFITPDSVEDQRVVTKEEKEGESYNPRAVVKSFSAIDELEIPDIIADTLDALESDEVETIALSQEAIEPKPERKNEEVQVDQEEGEIVQANKLENADTSELFLDVASAEEVSERDELNQIDFAPSQKSMQVSSEESMSRSQSTSIKKSAQPEGGYPAYQSYISSNLKKTDDMKSGSVVVSFEFKWNGAPKDIKVVKSLCEACDQEAIRLIDNGPKWDVEDRKERVTYEVVIP